LGSSQASPQVMTWDRNTGKIALVADNATLPRWMP